METGISFLKMANQKEKKFFKKAFKNLNKIKKNKHFWKNFFYSNFYKIKKYYEKKY